MSEFTDEELEEITFLTNLSSDFNSQAAQWWNGRASPSLKRLIVSASYYEHLAHQSLHAEDYFTEENTNDD